MLAHRLTALPVPIEPLDAIRCEPYGWMLGKPVRADGDVPAFVSPTSDFWREHLFDVREHEATCLMLTRPSTTYDLIVHLKTGAPACESAIRAIDARRIGGLEPVAQRRTPDG